MRLPHRQLSKRTVPTEPVPPDADEKVAETVVENPLTADDIAFYARVVREDYLPLAEKVVERYRSYYTASTTELTRPFPGVQATILDDSGRETSAGYLAITAPWPSMLRTIWGDNARYQSAYWGQFGNKYYVAGDGAHIDADGYHWIMGRVDDVLNVSGHRLGTMEVESALVSHPRVAEAAVVGRPHEIKGEAVFAFVILKAEGVKVLVIVILLWLVLASYKEVVLVGFIGTFIVAVIIFSMAIFLRNPAQLDAGKQNVD